MIKKITQQNKTWVFISRPTTEELSEVVKEYKVHSMVAEELSRPTLRPKVEKVGSTLYLVLHFPVFLPEEKTSVGMEIDFVVGKNFLITATHTHTAALGEFFDAFERDGDRLATLPKSNIGMLLYELLNHLYAFALRELDHIKVKIDGLDAHIANDHAHAVVRDIFAVRRDILNFRRAIKPHETVIDSLEKAGTQFFGEPLRPYLQDISGEYYKVWNLLENHKETVEALYDANISYISMRSTEVIKKLTLVAFITFPLTLAATIFSMKIAPDSILGAPYDFVIFVSIVVAAILGMLRLFKKRQWF